MAQENPVLAPKKFPFLWIPAILFALCWLVVSGGPFVFQIFTTFKTQDEFMFGGLFSLPRSLSFENFATVLKTGFHKYFFNSIIVIAISLTLLLFVSALAAYPLSRLQFRLNRPIYAAIVAAMAIPIHITLIPVFMMTIKINIYDSIFALIGPNIAFNLPMSIFILHSFMLTISREMEEAAEIDGCGRFATFFRIIFPLSKPGLATLAIYNGVVIWNEFIFAMTLTSSKAQTLPLAIWQYTGQYSINTPMIMTLLLLTSLPLILLYIIFQEKLVKGMMAGAIKG